MECELRSEWSWRAVAL